jgi:nicotinate-nucleotide adenylyltransferase
VIGILGGTFDPVHYGHLRPAREVFAALGLEVLHVIPACCPPHRPPPIASAADRFAMVALALADEPGFLADDREIRRGGLSYTVPTLESLRAEYGPQRPLVLLLGSDAFRGIETWHAWRRLPELAHLVIVNRPGSPLPEPEALAPWARARLVRSAEALRAAPAGCLYFQPVTPVDISATLIRARLARGEPVEEWLPPAVLAYIRRHGLYGASAAATRPAVSKVPKAS